MTLKKALVYFAFYEVAAFTYNRFFSTGSFTAPLDLLNPLLSGFPVNFGVKDPTNWQG